MSDIWIVDNASDRVYQYTAAAARTSGSQTATASFALAAGNTSPQGIADPPAGSVFLQASPTPVEPVRAHRRAHAHFATVDQLLGEPESAWTRKSRLKVRV